VCVGIMQALVQLEGERKKIEALVRKKVVGWEGKEYIGFGYLPSLEFAHLMCAVVVCDCFLRGLQTGLVTTN